MKDTIYREDAIKALIEWYGCKPNDIEAFEKIIEAIPSAGRPQGEWIYCEDEYGIDGYRCSNCGKHIPWDYQHKFINFIDDYHTCPFCDARMKGAEDAQTVKIVTHGNCGRCGKPIEGDSIFLCDECISLLKGVDDDTI